MFTKDTYQCSRHFCEISNSLILTFEKDLNMGKHFFKWWRKKSTSNYIKKIFFINTFGGLVEKSDARIVLMQPEKF